MAGALKKVGHRAGARDRPGHRAQLPPRREGPTINRLVDALAARGPRSRCPAGSSLVTPTLKYNRQAWLRSTAWGALGAGPHRRRAAGRRPAWSCAPGTSPRSACTCPAAGPRSSPGQAPQVMHRRPAAGRPAAARRIARGRRRSTGRAAAGRPAALPEDGLRKRHDLQGPIDDAFMDSFLFVTPSGKALSPQVGDWVNAEQTRAIKEWRRQFRGEPRVRQDTPAHRRGDRRAQPGAVGRPAEQPVFARIADKLPIQWTQGGRRVGKQTLIPRRQPRADGHLPQPAQPRALRRAEQRLHLPRVRLPEQRPPDAQAARLGGGATPACPPDARAPGKVVAADFFGERWELRPAKPPARATGTKVAGVVAP